MKYFKMVYLLGFLLLLLVIPAAAQEAPADYPLNTISVTGTGDANGVPDIATIDVGVESRNEDSAIAFVETNQKVENIINQMLDLGIAREDIRTSGLSIYQDYYGGSGYGGPPPFMAQPAPATTETPEEPPAPVYVVSNTVSVTIRDIAIVPDVIDAVVGSGATNLYGVNFGIDNRTALETEARAEAFADALNRATQLAELAGVELGDALMISESYGGYYPYASSNMLSSFGSGGDGSGGAIIEPGQLSVSIQVVVVFRINP